MTLIEKAKKGIATPLIKKIAKNELRPINSILEGLARGTIVIPRNNTRSVERPAAIGEGLCTKINANIGTSEDFSSISFELKKLKIAESYGADTVMDLSTSNDLKVVRKKILKDSHLPLGTVPIYEIAILGAGIYGSIGQIPERYFIETIRNQAKEGIDFFTIHAGVTLKTLQSLRSSGRIMGIVSRGGAILLEWMTINRKENPFFKHFSEIVSIAKKYDVTLSLGDGMRPGAISDATDTAQIDELLVLGELQKEAFENCVQVIIEGPGHVPLNQIKSNVELEKSLCNNAPLYVLGPLVTDIAPGYDHITGAIGGAIAASHGADFLCYVTPAEHLRLPTLEDVKDGVIASKIAAHAADIAKNVPGARSRDDALSKARFSRNWQKQFTLCIDPVKSKKYRKSSSPKINDVCTMCGQYCAIRISDKCFKNI